VASSALRQVLNRQDDVLGPWVPGRDPLEDALAAFAGAPLSGSPQQPRLFCFESLADVGSIEMPAWMLRSVIVLLPGAPGGPLHHPWEAGLPYSAGYLGTETAGDSSISLDPQTSHQATTYNPPAVCLLSESVSQCHQKVCRNRVPEALSM
jgi:hypothetical protein